MLSLITPCPSENRFFFYFSIAIEKRTMEPQDFDSRSDIVSHSPVTKMAALVQCAVRTAADDRRTGAWGVRATVVKVSAVKAAHARTTCT